MSPILALAILAFITCQAAAEEVTMDKLAGGWRYVSTYVIDKDGIRTHQFKENPAGIFIILPNGVCSHIIMEPDLPPIKSGLIKQSLPEERERLTEGQLSWFGKCRVNPDKRSFTAAIEKSSFPNFEGKDQVREIQEISRDTMRYVNTLTTAGEGSRVFAHLRRVW